MVDYSKYVRREGVQPEAAEPNAEPNTEQSSEPMEQPRDGGLIDVVKRLFGGDRVLWIIITNDYEAANRIFLHLIPNHILLSCDTMFVPRYEVLVPLFFSRRHFFQVRAKLSPFLCLQELSAHRI